VEIMWSSKIVPGAFFGRLMTAGGHPRILVSIRDLSALCSSIAEDWFNPPHRRPTKASWRPNFT
jgi:hypothetical protein